MKKHVFIIAIMYDYQNISSTFWNNFCLKDLIIFYFSLIGFFQFFIYIKKRTINLYKNLSQQSRTAEACWAHKNLHWDTISYLLDWKSKSLITCGQCKLNSCPFITGGGVNWYHLHGQQLNIIYQIIYVQIYSRNLTSRNSSHRYSHVHNDKVIHCGIITGD